MSDAIETRAERASRMLAALAEINLSAAEILRDKMAASDTAAEARDLALALHRVSRSVRQTLLLEERLERAVRAAAREAAADQAKASEAEIEARAVKVRHKVMRVVLDAREQPEADELIERLDDWAKDYVKGHGGAAAVIEEVVAVLCRDLLGVDPPQPPQAPPEPPPPLIQQPDYGWTRAPP